MFLRALQQVEREPVCRAAADAGEARKLRDEVLHSRAEHVSYCADPPRTAFGTDEGAYPSGGRHFRDECVRLLVMPSVLPSPPEPTRIVIADDDPFFVQMLRAELAECDQLEVVGTAANGAEAIDLVEELQPAVVLMDVAMPVLDGVDAMREIRNMPHPPAVVVITGREEEVSAHAAYQEGAQAYLRKSEDLPLLIGVVVAVSQLAAA